VSYPQAVAGSSVTVSVALQREVDEDEEESVLASLGKVVCPRYPSEKVESWWLVLGDSNRNGLLAIKRITLSQRAKVDGSG